MSAPSFVPELTPAQRKSLKARAHPLHPVVTIGAHGLTQAVLREIDISLKSHELIKIRAVEDRAVREDYLMRICQALGVAPVQHIGKILVLYRPNPELPEAAPPAAKTGKRTSAAPERKRQRAASAGRAAKAPSAARPGRAARRTT
ncbi:MAG: YhbY family RNA-binding protein [Burkholderiales bacterium]|nr:YhbY family RNA-binding protein [Burkholderiales bacterium]